MISSTISLQLWQRLSFFLIFSEHPWDKPHANILRVQFPHWHQTVHFLSLKTHDGYYPWNSLFGQSTLVFWLHYSSHTSSLNLLYYTKSDARFMQDGRKAVWSIPYVSVAFFPSLKHNFIAYYSSKVSSRPDWNFEIHQQWQSGYSGVYSNSCCSCSFEAEIIKICQSSHKMYSNNIVIFQESTTILNACTKKSGNLLKVPSIYIYRKPLNILKTGR